MKIIDLINELQNIDITEFENDNRERNDFRWAWIVSVRIPKELARKLKIKKQDWNWTLFRKWSNWALVNLENIIDWIVAQYKRYNPSENITTSTYLL